jgi:hypothetical protein
MDFVIRARLIIINNIEIVYFVWQLVGFFRVQQTRIEESESITTPLKSICRTRPKKGVNPTRRIGVPKEKGLLVSSLIRALPDHGSMKLREPKIRLISTKSKAKYYFTYIHETIAIWVFCFFR